MDKWHGDLLTTTDETTDAQFFSRDDLPEISEMYQETLTDLGKSEKVLRNRIARNPLFLEGNHNFARW